MKKICIIGGCGHIGIPLGLALASKNFDVILIDKNEESVNKINNKELPFQEVGADELLKKHIGLNLRATTKKEEIKNCSAIIFATATDIDKSMNPKTEEFLDVIKSYLNLINKEQLIILRSTLFPGTMDVINDLLKNTIGSTKLAYCPERILQGKGIEELFNLPQIISATSEIAKKEANDIFSQLTQKTIYLEPKEAELAKLMTNTWRYIEFSIANQFYMIAEEAGLDFYKIYNAIKEDYPRANHFPKAGLTAGPCLYKDTVIFSEFCKHDSFLGHNSIIINDSLPSFLVRKLEKNMGSLKNKKIALLGLTFKPNNDDIRESLSFKIKKELEDKMAEVIVSDPYIKGTVDHKEAVEIADGIILGVPHSEFISLNPQKPYVDCWGVWG